METFLIQHDHHADEKRLHLIMVLSEFLSMTKAGWTPALLCSSARKSSDEKKALLRACGQIRNQALWLYQFAVSFGNNEAMQILLRVVGPIPTS